MTIADWLFGPKRLYGDASGWVLGSSYTVSISDVRSIENEMRQVFPTVLYFRGDNSPMGPGMMTRSDNPVDPTALSDADLGALFIEAYTEANPQFPTPVALSVVIGDRVAAGMTESLVSVSGGQMTTAAAARANGGELTRRIESILTSGRRRIPGWRAIELARIGGVLVLLAVLVATAIAVWDNPSLVVVAALAVVSFAWQADARFTQWVNQRPGNPARRAGRVRIDATDYAGLRTKRANGRRDLKVALVTLVSGVALAVLAWALDFVKLTP